MVHDGVMTTYVRSAEAAEILGVAPATLYAYVSRGRVQRRTAPDGRSSLFALDEIEALAERTSRSPTGPRPTIDVRISSNITHLDEAGVTIRGHELPDLVRTGRFEDVAELLWTSDWSAGNNIWPAAPKADRHALAPIGAMVEIDPIGRMAIAAHQLDALHPDDDAATAARRLLTCVPQLLGSRRQTGQFAQRLAESWVRSPSSELVDAIDTALSLLADHELATSTLAVRVAASVRSSPYLAIAAGLATVKGRLHGSASEYSHRFLQRCMTTSPAHEIAVLRGARERVPGFGHKVYSGEDPRFAIMLDVTRTLAELSERTAPMIDIVDDVLAEVGSSIPKHPNVDLALGAFSWIAGLDPTVPIFAVARIAGWAAHYAEELDAPPVRYRGIAG